MDRLRQKRPDFAEKVRRGLTPTTCRPTVRAMTRLFGLTLVGVLLPVFALADITGTATVIDGDTLEVAGERICLHGIDAPESGQVCDLGGKPWQCGLAATDTLRELIGGKQVVCEGRNKDRYGRLIARCKVGWLDLGAEMVTRGMAVAYLRFSDDYIRNYREARGKGNGIFAGEFVEPEKWRRGERHPIAVANENVPAGCRIKGNVSKSGERIYHVPGGQWYARTKITPSKGERWFCGEEAARAAGWRRAGR